jgi:hypothetical protein
MAINSYPDNSGGEVNFPDQLIDPVSKFRVSNPENLIDTDFEYGLQPTKWETVELINNTPSFFSKSGDTTIDGISSIITNANTREIIVKTELDHGLAVGIPINVTGTKSITADGAYIINSIPDPKTFTYLCKDLQQETNSILDLYSSIITGEFFQGSQLRISDSDGIVTDAEGTSTLTVTTNTTHGFGENTPFYFLNLNSTVAQEFQAANTASKTFDASNSATAQTFDGSNSLSSVNIDWSNSATFGGTPSTVSATNTTENTITVSHTTENFNNLPLGTPLYYNVSATGGYFNTNPRGVVFLKTVNQLGTSTSTFQISLVPDGSAIDLTSNLIGTFQIANQARTFAGNNIDALTQTVIDVEVGPTFNFDAGNQGYTGAVQPTDPPNNTLTVNSYTGTTINAEGASAVDYYIGAMVFYSTTGTAATGLTANTTYFVTSVTNNGLGNYDFSVAALPGGTPISITTGTGSGTQTFARIGISVDKDIVHIPNSNFSKDDMIEYTFPVDGRFDVSAPEEEKIFYFVDTAYDAHNYKLSEDLGFKPVVATGGTLLPEITAKGRTWKVHRFTTTGTSNFVVSDIGKEAVVEYLIVGGGGSGGSYVGGGGGGGGVRQGSFTLTSAQTYSIVVGAGAAGAGSTSASTSIQGNNGGSSSAFGITATGGGGGGRYAEIAGSAGGSGGGAGGFQNGTGAGGAGTSGQGFAGGSSQGPRPRGFTGGGGGGGAQVAGETSTNALNSGGDGGAGVPSLISGSLVYYGGGGGGGNFADGVRPGNGGLGGGGGGSSNFANVSGLGGVSGLNVGGNGSPSGDPNNLGGNGGANTGGGGGGNGHYGLSGAGGSGIVIIRYPITPPVEFIAASATGGTTSTTTVGGVTYRIHSFTSLGSQTFTVNNIGSWNQFEFLVVAGGGSGAGYVGGGGGGGGFIEGVFSANTGNYSVTVGDGAVAGGTAGTEGGFNGQNSSITGLNLNITAIGGGGGGNHDNFPGKSGGSGGGASSTNGQSPVGGLPSFGTISGSAIISAASHGFRGGNTTGPRPNSNCEGAGGGGAGGPAPDHLNVNTGPGGPGRPSSILGTTYYFSGGGGGGSYLPNDAGDTIGGGRGGRGGGGGGGAVGNGSAGAGGGFAINAGQNGSGVGGAGGANTGGGGGSSGLNDPGGRGGSGIVVIRYPIAVA